jgi:hypothetical protein
MVTEQGFQPRIKNMASERKGLQCVKIGRSSTACFLWNDCISFKQASDPVPLTGNILKRKQVEVSMQNLIKARPCHGIEHNYAIS